MSVAARQVGRLVRWLLLLLADMLLGVLVASAWLAAGLFHSAEPLGVTGFLLRLALIFVTWIVLSFALRRVWVRWRGPRRA